MPSISLNAEILTHIGSLPVSNTLLATWLTMLILTFLAISLNRGIANGYQGFGGAVALLLEGLVGVFEEILGWPATKK